MFCPICNSKNIIKKYDLYDDRYGYTGIFSLYQCLSCNHKFIDNKFTSKDLENLYSNYYPRTDFAVSDYSPHKFNDGFKSWLNGRKKSAYTWVPKMSKSLI